VKTDQALKPSFLTQQTRIFGALIMREMATRYGRRGGGFLWVIGEPLIFCFGVITMWILIGRGHDGIAVAPFVMSGYMCLIMLRHAISFSTSAISANMGLLYHSQISPLHFYLSRMVLELAGSSSAFIIVYVVLLIFRQVDLPHNLMSIYGGWILMWVMAMGTGFILAGFAMRSEVFERFVPLVSYGMIPLSGVFFMIDWLPEAAREIYLWVPFPNAVEMVRNGVFGEQVTTHFRTAYAIFSAFGLLLFGLLLLRDAGSYVDVE